MDLERISIFPVAIETLNRYDDELGGTQIILRFANGFGASVVQNRFTFDRVELAVIEFASGDRITGGKLCYDTPITSDVMRFDNPEQLLATLRDIASL